MSYLSYIKKNSDSYTYIFSKYHVITIKFYAMSMVDKYLICYMPKTLRGIYELSGISSLTKIYNLNEKFLSDNKYCGWTEGIDGMADIKVIFTCPYIIHDN